MVGKPPPLVDRLLRPIDFGRLKEEHSAPSVSGVRSIVSSHPAQGLTPDRLASILRESENSSPLRYLELAEEMEEKDLHYLGVLGTRKRAVAQLEITVKAGSDDAADQKAADMVREWLERDELETELFDILDAIGKGFSRTEVIWDMTATAWTPVRLEWRDPRWFTFDPVDGRTPLLVDGGASGNAYGEPLPPFKYICHDHKAKSGLPIRGGLARAAAWGYLFKNYALKDWVSFAEIFGLPLRVGKYGAGETEENIRRLMQAVTDIGSDAAAVIPQSMMIEFITAGGATGTVDLYEKICEYLDKQVSKATLGQTATTDAAPGAGLSGSGSQHGDVRDDIKRSDAKQLAATINRDLITPYVRLNLGQEVRPPKLTIGQAEAWDPTVMMPAVQTFVSMGGRVGMSAIRDKLGIEDPGEEEALLQAPSSATPENPPQEPLETPGGRPTIARTPQTGSRPLLEPLKRPFGPEARAAAAVLAARDPIDDLVDDSLGDWSDLAIGVIGPAEDLVAGCSSFEELKARLATALGRMDSRQVTERLARASFNARLAGIAGVSLIEEETP
ncbi:DUF935 domain-containing protein [Brevundimonas vitis]|uniref:DUF935 domain-containing protein n=1 Tax=Brevundimonas vitisensis TaxID=2800818 RepID=A0ABX7BSH1_9CAUL|nr:DUF935 domain-containing protein [Brevundimonas vitisensis]QQQ19683.1 DUF935 domain-containing protein [Brevundimonas vitisensis]